MMRCGRKKQIGTGAPGQAVVDEAPATNKTAATDKVPADKALVAV